MNNLVHARFNPFSEFEPTIRFEAEVGKTIAEILTSAPEVPSWFCHSGEVRINGRRVDRGVWNVLRPKLSRPDCPIIITLHPVFHGGGGGGSTKNIITTVAAIALVAGATLVSGGLLGPAGLGLLGVAFASGGIGANLLAAGLALSATFLLSTLTPPAPPKQDSDGNRQLSNAGISQNPVRPMQALPVVLGRVRYSPPLIAPPYSTLENGIVYIHAVFGLAGYYSIDTADIMLNAVAIDQFAEVEYEVRDGAPSNSVLTICNETVIEKRGQNSLLSPFIVGLKQNTDAFLVHQDDPDRDLPQWQNFKTAGEAEEIRIRLFWGAIQAGEAAEVAFVPIRVEIRERGTSTWLKMPVAHFRSFRLNEQVRKEIRLKFEALPGGAFINHDEDQNCTGIYYNTGDSFAFEYNAESYFANTVPTDQIPVMTNYTTSGVTISMSTDTASFRAWQAADNNTTTFGWAPTSGVLPSWIKVDFGAGNAKTILSYLMSMGLPSGAKDWVLEGSNNDAAWTTVATVTGFDRWPTGGSFGPFWFQVDAPGSYRYYRLTITAGTDPSDNIILNDWRLGLTNAAGSDTSAIFASHVNIHDDGVDYYLDPATFPIGEYEVRVKRGLAGKVAQFDDDNYEYSSSGESANFFDYYDAGGTTNRYRVRIGQSTMSAETVLESFSTVSSDYPFGSTIHQKGVAMIAVRAPSVTIETLSAIFHSIVPIWSADVWSTDAASSNPAALARHVLLSTEQNAEALPGELIDEEAFQDFYDFCVSEGHEFNGVVDGLSVIEVFRQVLAAGFAAPDWPGYWSVIYEYDRSAETPVQVFTPLDTRGLTVTKSFPRLPHAFRPVFFDEDDDFNVNEASLVYADGYDVTNATRIEEMQYPGFTDATKVAARALFDLRQMRLRPTRYTFEIGLAGLACRRGDLVLLRHDVVSRYHSFSRIVSIQRAGGNITGLTLESQVDLSIAAGEVEENMAAVIQFNDRTTGTHQLNEQTLTDVVTFTTPFADPGDILAEDMTVGFGVVETETRRMLVLWYEYVDELTRRITLIDEAPGLHD